MLDLAAGTLSTVELAKSGRLVWACDFSVGMLKAGSRRAVPKVAGDATKLPFGDGRFDAVTISFGLRNVVDTVGGLREMARVTRPGGRLVCASSPRRRYRCSTVYKEYLMRAPLVPRGPTTRVPTSIWPSRSGVAGPGGAGPNDRVNRLVTGAVAHLTGGIVALHAGSGD